MTGPSFPEDQATLTLAGPAGPLEVAVDRADASGCSKGASSGSSCSS